MKLKSILITCFLLPLFLTAQNTDVFNFWSNLRDPENDLYQNLKALAFDYLDEREAEIASLDSQQDWELRQQYIKEKLNEMMGPFPEKTPLNPVITGKLEKEDMIIEKLYFESYPGYYVTSVFIYPKGHSGKMPTIIFCSGHTPDSFRSPTYQTMIFNYVKKGFAVLAFDPIGQGERIQYLSDNGKPTKSSTIEHSYPGVQSFLAGRSPAHYFVWDGIRAIDYLETRSDVDMNRIGITGRSGGGTQTAYIAAIDDRIYAAAPECYITSFKSLMNSMGPQDGEQNMINGIYNGIDLSDYINVRAPKPNLMVTTTSDIFSIHGARKVFSETKRAYAAFGFPDHTQKVEDDAGHMSTLKNREATYAFFQKHLKNPGSSKDQKIDTLSNEELFVTPTGNVFRDLKGENMYSLNKKWFKTQQKSHRLITEGSELDPLKFVGQVRDIIGYQPQSKTGIERIFSGRSDQEYYMMEKYLLHHEDDSYTPLLWLKPKSTHKGMVLYLDELGKSNALNEEASVKQLLAEGYSVIALDLLGVGENGGNYQGGDARIQDVPVNVWFASLLINQPIIGKRVQEIAAAIDLIEDNNANHLPLYGMSTGSLGVELLHTELLTSAFNGGIILDSPLYSYEDMINNLDYKAKFIFSSVAGGPRYYDLPDIMKILGNEKILLLDPRSGNDTVVETSSNNGLTTSQIKSETSVEAMITVDEDNKLNLISNFLSKHSK
ncbi:alpha/beta hydrolase family protein [Membranihabitans marinus]|uniref:alpha/beta hydrolase family protein n=1 Tax=Membranihabitans marinus TaxID=1227546 RepID=UPI001F21FC32|nr:acetylxylan esterase [Membranihabitans marinus]